MGGRGFAGRLGSILVGLVVVGPAVVWVSTQDGALYKDSVAATMLQDARAAIGHGQGKVLSLKTLVLKGKSRVALEGQPAVDAVVEMRILLPDHYLRVDVAPASRLFTGFAGKTLLTAVDDGVGLTAPPMPLRDGLLQQEQARLARLLLGMAAYVSPHYFITFTSNRNDPHALEGERQGGFFLVMSLDGGSRPVSLRYRTVRDEMNTMSFADRRDADGLQLPFRITTTKAGRTIDDITLDQIRVNPPLGDEDFVVKNQR
jgi:hypothetical protein